MSAKRWLGVVALISSSVALAQGAAVVPVDQFSWGTIAGVLGVIGTALAGLVKVLHDILATVYRWFGAADARWAAFEEVVKNGSRAVNERLDQNNARLDQILAEQRRSADAAIQTSERVGHLEQDVQAIHFRIGDEPTEERKRRAGASA